MQLAISEATGPHFWAHRCYSLSPRLLLTPLRASQPALQQVEPAGLCGADAQVCTG